MTQHLKPSVTVLDSIIFGLQQHGGISTYWAKLLDACENNTKLTVELILPRNIRFSGFNDNWSASFVYRQEKISARISRYLSVHCDTHKVFHTSYYRVPSKKPALYVATAYDFMYERYRTGLARHLHTTQKRRSLERADIVSCISAFTRDEVLEFFPTIDPLRLKVVPLGVDTDVFYPDPKDKDRSLARTVLFVGQRGGYKRFDLAVEAVRACHSAVSLGVIGPPLTNEERDQLNSLLHDRWKYLGSVSTSRLRELYSSAFALLFPSDCEGFGLPVLEAMACRCPVVASNRASLPEVGGAAALYASEQRPEDYADALTCLDRDNFRNHKIAEGLTRISQFTWANTCRETLEIYRLNT